MPPIDVNAVAALADERLDWRFKAVPPAWWGSTVAEVVTAEPRLSELPTPLLTLSLPALEHNVDVLARWCADRSLDLCPHGKTTMAPRLWQRQLDAGAWGITVANSAQLWVARAFGVTRVMVANTLISPLALRRVATDLAAHPDVEIHTWADAVDTVALMQQALAETEARVGVLVELGGPGGRTGARDLATALDVANAVASAPNLRFAGVAGYEGALAHDSDAHSQDVVRGYLQQMVELHVQVADLVEGQPIVSAGGSAYFELVADVLGPLVADGARVVLRSGAYLAHDDGFYRHISPLGEDPRTDGPVLHSAMHGWVRVSSQPEPGLALVDAGKRDLPFDEGLPTVQKVRPDKAVRGVTVTALNDQHGFLSFDPKSPSPVRIGDELRLGLSHPCTAFDKWTLIPVLDDADADDPVVVDLVRTFF